MCHGHPRYHPCAHTSIIWYYCPSAVINLETGYETPCSKISFAAGQPTSTDCPLQNCYFKEKGGSWTCCACNQGPNTQGWCTMPHKRLEQGYHDYDTQGAETTCDHGCCPQCTGCGPSESSSGTSPTMTFAEPRKGSASRKLGYSSTSRSYRQELTLSDVSDLNRGKGQAHSSKSHSGSKAGSSKTNYKIEMVCRTKKHEHGSRGSHVKVR